MGKKRKRQILTTNLHHLLYQRRHWESNGYGIRLRNRFVYEMSVTHHNKIHDKLHDIPLPSPDELERLSKLVDDNSINLANMSAHEACEWLAEHCEFEPFKACMKYQAELLK